MATKNVLDAAHGTLTASVVEIVNLSNPSYLIIVRNRGTVDLYYTVAAGGTNAATPAAANDSYICPAGQAITVSRPLNQPVTQVKLFSTGSPLYSVEGF